ncbi:MAG: hypothetical protein K6E50_12030 [Lachnospiraceae bacterium]|nr:hypothetical protein [Lachnospiraceae bacterium]
MNGNNLLAVLLSSIKSRFAGIMSRLRMWTSWNFIQSRIITKIRSFFMSIFDVKPKNKDDYFTIFGWMVSKKLAYALVIICGVASIWYIVAVRQVFAGFGDNGGIRTYRYNSVQLRLAKGKARILGKSGYLAYEGDVEDGYVTGEGTLYAPDGSLVYQGHFEKNQFENLGKQYYPDGGVQYEGNFHNNLYDGNGRLYRDGGTLLYEGNFVRGKKSGEGTLYGDNNSMVFAGSFANDGIVYAAFPGKTAEEVGKMYSGSRRIWQADEEFCVYMSDINAIYWGITDEESLDDSLTVESVYVLSDTFPVGDGETNELENVKQALGEPIYEGNSAAILPEALAINILNETKPAFYGSVEMDTELLYSDVTLIDDYQNDYSVYLTSYQSSGLIYTFVSEARDGKFAFYCITKAEENAR